MSYKPVEIYGVGASDGYYREGNNVWIITRLIESSKDLEVFDLPLCCFCIGSEIWKPIRTALDLARHMKRVQEVSLDYPVILDEEGFIMDGWHRVAKALLEGLPAIKAVRFDKTPPCDYTEQT